MGVSEGSATERSKGAVAGVAAPGGCWRIPSKCWVATNLAVGSAEGSPHVETEMLNGAGELACPELSETLTDTAYAPPNVCGAKDGRGAFAPGVNGSVAGEPLTLSE